MHSVTKQYRDFPAAHRQPKHDGHCRLIHGHNWGFDITFTCERLDECGFVIDVGKMNCVKKFLNDTFDHTLLLNLDDPSLEWLMRSLDRDQKAKIVVVPNCGMEGLAEFVLDKVAFMIGDDASMLYDRNKDTGARRGLKVIEVTCWEDSKNSATCKNP